MTSSGRLTLASYKLRIHDNHVRALPATSSDGAVFTGPGVDLRGDDAKAVIEAATPVFAWLDAREPGVRVRIRSISVAKKGPRVLVSLEPTGSDPRPRALRFDPPSSIELCDAAHEVERVLSDACSRVLARRRA